MIAAFDPFAASASRVDAGALSPLGSDLPMALRVTPPRFADLCRNGKCLHSDSYHHQIYGGVLGDRYACDVCSAEGGRCR